jgi:hypothetical protein
MTDDKDIRSDQQELEEDQRENPTLTRRISRQDVSDPEASPRSPIQPMPAVDSASSPLPAESGETGQNIYYAACTIRTGWVTLNRVRYTFPHLAPKMTNRLTAASQNFALSKERRVAFALIGVT